MTGPRRLARLGRRRQVVEGGGIRRQVDCRFCGTKLGDVTTYPSGSMSFQPVHGLLMGEDGTIRPYPGARARPRRLEVATSAMDRTVNSTPGPYQLAVWVDHMPPGGKTSHLQLVDRSLVEAAHI